MTASRPVPVTLVSGFLGAGKTTLVNRMLHDAQGIRLAVLVNDFGAVNIDAELIGAVSEDVIVLVNGCICCSLAGGLQAAVSGVLRRECPPDAILIESSGVGDPGEVVRALSDADLQRHAPLDGIVTVVDAAAIGELDATVQVLVQRQIAAADLVVLNKTDLVDADTLDAARDRVLLFAPGARIVPATEAQVPLGLLLGLTRTRAEMALRCEPVPEADADFESLLIVRTEPIEAQCLHAMLACLPREVFRVKGIVHLAERPRSRCVLQFAGRRATISIGDPWGQDIPVSRIVFIAAKGYLDPIAIAHSLK